MATQTKQQVEEIAPFEAAQEIEGGDVVLVDTREPHEYQEAHLENGKLVPPGLLADEIAEAAPDKSARTIVYCRSGNRSEEAGKLLIEHGFKHVYNIEHGFEGELDDNHHRSTVGGWRHDGLPWEQC